MESNDVKFKLIPLTKEEYISLKKEAYKLVDKFREYSLKEKYNFLKSLKFKDSTSYKIFLSTLILPNDAEILKEKDKIKLISVFSKKTGLSTKISRNLVLFKIAEYKITNLEQYINFDNNDENNLPDRISLEEASKKPIDFSGDDVDELMTTIFPDQPYVQFQQQVDNLFRKKIEKLFLQRTQDESIKNQIR